METYTSNGFVDLNSDANKDCCFCMLMLHLASFKISLDDLGQKFNGLQSYPFIHL